MRAMITWKRMEDGGRTSLPAGVGTPPYATVVRFCDDDGPLPPANAWSLIVEKREEAGSAYEWLAEVRFLFDEAPHAELRPRREFELYEGAKCVAAGKLLDS